MIDAHHPELSISRQCQLLGLSRSVFYYQPVQMNAEDLGLMRQMDELYLKYPFYGTRRMTAALKQKGYLVNRKRIQRLYQLMGLEAIGPKPTTSQPIKGHKIYPYLLRNVKIQRVNQAWATDLTYIPMPTGFMYLMAVVDLYSRKVISWGVSNSMDTQFCCRVLKEALKTGKPQIFNTDQGSQFTSDAFAEILSQHDIQISMDGKGKAIDNIFVERLWRSVKYEYLYLQRPETCKELLLGLKQYFQFYNQERLHQSLG
ncbi:putative transposase, partial [Catalinimonas alkaloidigena]